MDEEKVEEKIIIFEQLVSQDQEEPLKGRAVKALEKIVSDPQVLKAYEAKLREEFLANGDNFVKLNEIISYHLDPKGEIVFLHLAPARTFKEEERQEMILSGFGELAKRMAEEEDLQKVERVGATSWLVAKRPELFDNFGFTRAGPIEEEMRKKIFPNEASGSVHAAYASREVFLGRYQQTIK